MGKFYTVTLPIAGHAFVDVEAENESEALEKAFNSVSRDMIEEWEPLTSFTKGNVCYCPTPWEPEVEEIQ